ncbi:hydantoinase B/oxoprolinase family protein [Paenibacillus senegalimassiliensis]|uniref:hydantoinase B/oxoprolinase family protein n=1 Tax=Paenibacillus senegalimassiliensis TaxID=1737426 RepID=UPI00073E8EF1|nr:hydantoinase B/oxoprolinase family protein [Paenibacillus senegalimassiliensis]
MSEAIGYIQGTDIKRVSVDPVTLQVLGGAFKMIAQEMGIVLYRMSYSSIIRESEDLGAGICDAKGRQICESENSPMHAGSVGGYIQGILQKLEGNIHDGDVIIHNHPYYGASHTPDVQINIPIFYEGALIGYSAINAHLVDVGNAGAGVAIDARDIYAEARIYNALKLYERGKLNEQLWDMILDNVRTPSMNANDINALIAAAEHGKKRFLELIEKFGLETVFSASEEWMDYSERMLRREIAKVPDGVYHAESYLDDDGVNLGKPLRVSTTITIHGDSLTVDLTGSSDEVMTAFNVPFEGSTRPSINTAIHDLFLDDALHSEYIPQNEGLERPVHIIAPKGSIFNPNFPRASSARFNQVNRMADCIVRALAPVMPERVSAGSSANIHYIVYSGFNEEVGEYWVYGEVTEGSYGGRYGKDGIDTIDCLIANTRNVPIEETEWHLPLRVERYEIAPVEAAKGKWRGGIGVVRQTRFLENGIVGCEGDRHFNSPPGLFGGGDGQPASLVKNPGTDQEEAMPSKVSADYFKAGDVVQVISPSSGGYGNPLERDPQLVLHDVLDDFCYLENAEADYGVVIDPVTKLVDVEATARVRAARIQEFAS